MSGVGIVMAMVGGLFAVIAVWAFVRGPRIFDELLSLRSRRRALRENRAELASEVLAEMRNKAGVASARKPYVTPPEKGAVDEKTAAPARMSVNPWLSILFKPAATIRQIVEVDPQMHVMLISCVYGINALLGINNSLPGRPGLSNISYAVLLPVVLVAGPLCGLIVVALISSCFRLIAGQMGGVASEHETQAAVTWSLAPEIYTFPLTLVTALVVSPDVDFARWSGAATVVLLNLIVSNVAHVWSFVLWVVTLAEVNRFSRWKALGVMILSYCVLLLAVSALVLALLPFALVLK